MNLNITVEATATLPVHFELEEMGRALLTLAFAMCEQEDAGGDLYTDKFNTVYYGHAGEKEWVIANNEKIAAIANAGNALYYGFTLTLEKEIEKEQERQAQAKYAK